MFPPALQLHILVSLPRKQLFLSQPTVLAWQGRGFVLLVSPSIEMQDLIPALTLLGAGAAPDELPMVWSHLHHPVMLGAGGGNRGWTER